MQREVATVNEEFSAGLSVTNKMATTKVQFLLVDVHTKIDLNDPKGHILQIFPDLFEGVGMMEDV